MKKLKTGLKRWRDEKPSSGRVIDMILTLPEFHIPFFDECARAT